MAVLATFVFMSSKNIRLILILMLLTIGILFITQAYWFKKSFALEERQLDEKMNIALRNVADRLLKLHGDSTSQITPIEKLSSNEYLVHVNSYFTLSNLDSTLRAELQKRQLNMAYDYAIVEEGQSLVLLGNTITGVGDTTSIACKSREEVQSNRDFKLTLSNKSTYLLGAMGIWMYSSLTLMVILAVFTFIMVSIVKGKKLALLKKDFVNNMTHELKTPIANISVASDAIRHTNMDPERLKKYADIIYTENDRLHHLVDRVLQISAMEKENDTLTLEEVNLHEIVQQVAESFEPVMQQRGGSITQALHAGRFKLLADKVHLSNVIYNLIENAVKYSGDKPEITLRTSTTAEGISLEVEDKGIGMSKDSQERIFEKFFRAESGNLHNTKGYGLGLSYVKMIVERLGGLITFNSTEGLGSTFRIFLPT
jgi:two-component system phosphate regulon sensor histidine kinase PhoR